MLFADSYIYCNLIYWQTVATAVQPQAVSHLFGIYAFTIFGYKDQVFVEKTH